METNWDASTKAGLVFVGHRGPSVPLDMLVEKDDAAGGVSAGRALEHLLVMVRVRGAPPGDQLLTTDYALVIGVSADGVFIDVHPHLLEAADSVIQGWPALVRLEQVLVE